MKKNESIEWTKSIKIYKLNFIQKLLIKLKIIKDPRYNGKKINIYLLDEVGHWDFKNKRCRMCQWWPATTECGRCISCYTWIKQMIKTKSLFKIYG